MKDRTAACRRPEKLSKKVLDKNNTICYLIQAVFESESLRGHGALPGSTPESTFKIEYMTT